MRNRFFCFLAVLVIIISIGAVSGPEIGQKNAMTAPGANLTAPQQALPTQAPTVKTPLDYGRMPLYFIANTGQMAEQVAYNVQGKDKSIYFTPLGLTIVLSEVDKSGEGRSGRVLEQARRVIPAKTTVRPQGEGSAEERFLESIPQERWVVKLDFIGSNPDVMPAGKEQTGAVVSYFSGRPEAWHTGVPTYAKILYSNLWPGIDLIYSGTVNQLKYEFVVHPGADPSQIRLAYRGATEVKVDDAGRLEVMTPAGGFQDDTPVAYQEIDGEKENVPLAYKLFQQNAGPGEKPAHSGEGELQPPGENSKGKSHMYGFDVGAYDPAVSLILDPAVLVFCGYVGGSGSEDPRGITLDSSGCAYITGTTASTQTTFPITVGPDLTANGSSEAYVAKINAAGTGLDYCGYIGGSGSDYGMGVAVDSSGCAYVFGRTNSSETTFPVLAGPDLSYNGSGDTFIAKVRADGSGLLYCGYIGGSGDDGAAGFSSGMAIDNAGCVYITNSTDSDEITFPVLIGPDLTHNGYTDAFVAKVKADGTGLVYCGYIGGSNYERGDAVAVDVSGNAFVSGVTKSSEYSFPALVGPDLTFNGQADAFVAKVKADGTGLVYCGYIGGSGDNESGMDIAVDGSGSAYVGGVAESDETTFPVAVGPDLTFNGTPGYQEGFVAKVKADGTGLVYCGYIGGSGNDHVSGVGLDGSGCLYVGGTAGSSEATFPVSGGPDLTYNGSADAFVAKVKADGTGLVHCGYIGGYGYELGYALAVDSSGNEFISGQTNSNQSTFPVIAGPDLSHNGSYDSFVAKIIYWDPWAPKHAVGDFDGDGADEAAVDFGATGIYLYDGGAWSQLSSANAESLLAADVDGDNVAEILADLGSTGLWLWNGGAWGQLSGVNVESLAAGDVDADGTDEVVGDFGTVGLWLYNGGLWTQLSGVNADYVTVANADGGGGDEIFGDFGATGLWVWNTGAWSILSGVNVDYVMTGAQTGARFILGDFGATGLWLWAMPGLNAQLSGVNADYTIAANTDGDTEDEIIGDFGATSLWHWDGGTWADLTGTWSIWSGVNAEFMIRADVDGNGSDEVAADFGTIGLWLWNTGAWTQTSGVNPEYMLAGDFDGDSADEIMADFGTLGLWLWNAGAWIQISPLNPE